ncbi:hypothetical protein diail_9406 [Diaporthe ilicicola]|nr:hypothetical protein diail_9406 [Diaporthe ilicicola]
MDGSEIVLKIGGASFRWEDECPTKKRNRLAQREYRKRKKRCVDQETSRETDSPTKSPSPSRTSPETCDTATGLSPTLQPAEAIGTLEFFSPQADQDACTERYNIGQFYQDSLSNTTVYSYEEAPDCSPIASNPGIPHVPVLCQNSLGPGYLGVGTTGYIWPNEQGLPTPASEACAGLQVYGSVPVGVPSPSISQPSLPTGNQAGFVDSGGDLGNGRDSAMEHDLVGRAPVTSTGFQNRFEQILNICEAAGFQSVDSMAAEYYTASFPPDSPLAATQSRSRSLNLPELLNALYVASSRRDNETKSPWALDESQRFREQVLRLATKILIDEASQFEKKQEGQGSNAALPAARANHSDVRSGSVSTAHMETAKRDHWRPKRTLHESWPLLSELLGRPGRSEPLEPHKDIVCVEKPIL